jgi:cytochrome P450
MMKRFLRQLIGVNIFAGDGLPVRIPLLSPWSGRPALPFPHPWNFDQPIDILAAYFHGADQDVGPARHNRYLGVPGFSPVYVTRDPAVIRAITTDTGDQPGQFDRDTLPSAGIARATGPDTLLYANGSLWRHQRKLSASPFGKTGLFQPETFHEFAETFRDTVLQRLDALVRMLSASGQTQLAVPLEPEIKGVMLELLVNNFFGAEIGYEELRQRYVPAIERIIDHIVRDTVLRKVKPIASLFPAYRRGAAQALRDQTDFDELTRCVLAARHQQRGHWRQFKSDAPDEALWSNIKVFLAGALEATTSYASWAISHLARSPAAQQRVYEEVRLIAEYTPENLESATYFGHVLNETLRLTPSLYFLPRKATADTWIETADGRKLMIPGGTHILLDVWHANRHEDHWGVGVTGSPADQFVPERWEVLAAQGRGSKEMLHFGFGHGPRVCPGKHLGQLEVALVVGAFVKLFEFEAVHAENPARAGVSTKPLDGTLVRLRPRTARPRAPSTVEAAADAATGS